MRDDVLRLLDVTMTTAPGTMIAVAVGMLDAIVPMTTIAEGTVAIIVDIADLVTATIHKVDMEAGDRIEDTTGAAHVRAPGKEDAAAALCPDPVHRPAIESVREAAACLVEEVPAVRSVVELKVPAVRSAVELKVPAVRSAVELNLLVAHLLRANLDLVMCSCFDCFECECVEA